jgi:E3 ubiquitin-protein ligase UBR7
MEKHEFLALYTGWAIEEGSAEDSTVDVTGTDEPGTSSAEPEAKKIKLDPSTTKKVGECQKPDQKSEKYKGGSSFWPQEWRKNLCKCRDCMNLYEKEKVLFLVDLEDSIHYYEEKGKKMVKTSMESGMEALSSLDRTQQIEAIAGYNDMKTRLMNYLQSFVVNRTIVTEDDINKFFTSMKEEKSKGAAGQPPSTCR